MGNGEKSFISKSGSDYTSWDDGHCAKIICMSENCLMKGRF